MFLTKDLEIKNYLDKLNNFENQEENVIIIIIIARIFVANTRDSLSTT